MRVYIKGIRFTDFDFNKILDFVDANPKTQVIPAKLFFGEKHVQHALLETKKAFSSKTNICKKEGLEFLVRLVGERQIKEALKKTAPKKTSVFVCWSENCSAIFRKFKKEFKFTEFKPKEPPKEQQMDAIERTATFWLE